MPNNRSDRSAASSSANREEADFGKSLAQVGRLTVRIEELKAQKERLAGAYRKRERARDTRRKIILGALVIASNTDPQTKGFPPAAWVGVLNARLTDPAARALFNLPPVQPHPGGSGSTSSYPGEQNG